MSVFTPINEHQLGAFLKNYPVGELQGYCGIEAGITNSNFFVDTDSGRYVLSIVEHETHADVEWFMQLLSFLHRKNIPCAKPVQATSGDYTLELADKPATLVQCLNGADKAYVDESDCAALGKVLANLHVSCRDYPSTRKDSRGNSWREATATKIRNKLSSEDRDLLDVKMSQDYQSLLAALPGSVIHADLFRDNVLFANDKVSGIIDFYYACNGCMLYDLGITFNDWCRDDNMEVNPERARALLGGYESVRPLRTMERELWPEAIECSALRFWLSRQHDLHFPVAGMMTFTKDPKPLEKILRESPVTYVDLSL